MLCCVHLRDAEKMQRALKEETSQLECDLNEERSRYQNLLTEHLRLEEKYDDLKEEISLAVVNIHTHTHTLCSVHCHGCHKKSHKTKFFIFRNLIKMPYELVS